MRKLGYIFITTLILFSAGCASQSQKYVSDYKQDRYVLLNPDNTALFHTGSVENYPGVWAETEDDYTVTFDKDKTNLVFRKLDNNKIGMILDKNGEIEEFTKV